ncbi:MAG TPA: response regulator [Caulobacteraceae bacterium]|jgi:CheY-like chemotaxis protein
MVQRAPRRVLVVEDESLVAMLLEDVLGDLGCEVIGPAASVEQALALIAAGGFDFALLDVKLGAAATSFPVADALRAAGVPFAFVTGYGAESLRPDLRDTPVIAKPIDPEAIAALLAG